MLLKGFPAEDEKDFGVDQWLPVPCRAAKLSGTCCLAGSVNVAIRCGQVQYRALLETKRPS